MGGNRKKKKRRKKHAWYSGVTERAQNRGTDSFSGQPVSSARSRHVSEPSHSSISEKHLRIAQCMLSWESVIYYNQLVISQNCALIRTAGTGVSYIQLACTRNSTCCMDVDGVNEQWHIILRGKRFQNNGVEEDLSFKNAHNNRS